MDPNDLPTIEMNSTRGLLENVETARTQALVRTLREATHGHHVDAEGEAISTALLNELEYVVRSRGGVARDDVLYFLHPAQLAELRSTPEMMDAGVNPRELVHDGAQEYQGIPMIVDQKLPPAVVYLVDPGVVTMSGQVLNPRRTGRLTGLKHPDHDSE